MAAIDAYLKQVLERDGSDLHFLAGDLPRVRQYGELKPLANEPLNPEKVKTALYEIMPKLALERIDGEPALTSPLAGALIELGFGSGPRRLTLSA